MRLIGDQFSITSDLQLGCGHFAVAFADVPMARLHVEGPPDMDTAHRDFHLDTVIRTSSCRLLHTEFEDDLYLILYRSPHPRSVIRPFKCSNCAVLMSEDYGNTVLAVAPRDFPSENPPTLTFTYRNHTHTVEVDEGKLRVSDSMDDVI